MLRRLRRAAALVLVAQLAVVGVRTASAACAGTCEMRQDASARKLDDVGTMTDMPASMAGHAMAMTSHDAPRTDHGSRDGSRHGTSPAAPETCLEGANCAPPLSLVMIAGPARSTAAVSAPASRVVSMLTRAAAAPEAPPPKA